MVSLNPPWVWCHPIYWVVNGGFVCTVCAQVIQSWGRGFHRGPSSGHRCLIYSLMTWITRFRTFLWDYTLMTRLCLHQMSRPLPCKLLLWARVSAVCWFDANYLLINNAKTQALPIGPCKYDFDLTLNGSGVTKLPSIRILGVEPDSMLNFIEHIASQLIKAYETTGALRRIRRIVPMDVISAFKSFMLPHPEYCSPLLLGVGKSRPIKLKTPIIIC